MTTPVLEACPFCGNQSGAVLDDGRTAYVYCSNAACGSEGPMGYHPDQAIAAWNRRATVPAGAALEASQVRSALLSGLDKGRAIKLLERVMVWASGVAFKSADGEQLIADIDAYLAAVPADSTTNEPAPGEGPTK